MRRSYRPGRNWKTFYVCPHCHLCKHREVISFVYFTDDLVAKIMFAAKAGWEYDEGRWYCPDHRRNDVAP